MATMNRPIMLLLTVIQIWNKYLKFQLNRVVYLCLCNICTKFQVDTLFLSWVLLNNLTSIYSIWQRPWNHSTNIFIRIFLLHRIHCWMKSCVWDCENCSHFMLKWFQPNSFEEVCFLEEIYENMQTSSFENFESALYSTSGGMPLNFKF